MRLKNDCRIDVANEPSQSAGAVSPCSFAYSSMLKVTRCRQDSSSRLIISAAIAYCGTGPTGRMRTHFFPAWLAFWMRSTMSIANRE